MGCPAPPLSLLTCNYVMYVNVTPVCLHDTGLSRWPAVSASCEWNAIYTPEIEMTYSVLTQNRSPRKNRPCFFYTPATIPALCIELCLLSVLTEVFKKLPYMPKPFGGWWYNSNQREKREWERIEITESCNPTKDYYIQNFPTRAISIKFVLGGIIYLTVEWGHFLIRCSKLVFTFFWEQ